ncbi:uncharacterized protein MELLADRAFT_38671 [Melampsora larici-populina 98AG31]|uniref:AmmeMemoRadiSam system protein B n=1 Tax=Melampsora larici-populina (strain 98AG31 / pathotype 3-4-7) TaxID=747676 RepID=F4RZH4_MELLP|nr:uncharacterized protein MELLADRAFT_38671 [Melampsora larici-populina 98AG31]EGG02227.1 hypothetical protein MELLADRAFT_38671 [Melampsora larici-populina 98AG31]
MVHRSATHAGSWYTSSRQAETTEETQDWRKVAMPVPISHCKAVIAPHVGYLYSGLTAAWAYKTIDPSVIYPLSHVYLDGCALSGCEAYEIPLGNLEIDIQVSSQSVSIFIFLLGHLSYLGIGAMEMDIKTDKAEHSIELHLPYVRHISKSFQTITIVPILIGSISSEEELIYGKVLRPYLLSPENLFVISSDFCHCFSYTYYKDPARKLSSGASPPATPIYQSIEALDQEALKILESLSHSEFSRYLSQTKNNICGCPVNASQLLIVL